MIYRNICRAAGTHVYCESGDPLYVHPRLITLVAQTSGRKTIHLPQPCSVVDALGGKTLVMRGKDVEVSTRAPRTLLLAVTPE